MSKIHRPAISVARIVRFMKKPGRQDSIAVIVGTVTDDARIFEIPKLTVSSSPFMQFLFHIYLYTSNHPFLRMLDLCFESNR